MMLNPFLGRDAFIDFNNSITGISLIIPALFWLYFSERERFTDDSFNPTAINQNKTSADALILFWLTLIPLGLLIAPISSMLIKALIGNQPYTDTMISIPIVLIIVYAFIHFLSRLNLTGISRIQATICFVIVIVASCSIPISYEHPLGIELVSNSIKISPETQEICEKIDADYVLLPKEVYGQINEFDSGVKKFLLNNNSYGRYYAGNTAKSARNASVSAFVIRKSCDNPASIEYYGYSKSGETKHYIIYKSTK